MSFYKPFKQVVFLSLAFLFLGCEDKSYFTKIYNQELLDRKIDCLNLKILPNSSEIEQATSKLYRFDHNCSTVVTIEHKSNIVCNSPYSTNKSYTRFISITLSDNDAPVYTIYKDLKDENITQEVIKGMEFLWNHINL